MTIADRLSVSVVVAIACASAACASDGGGTAVQDAFEPGTLDGASARDAATDATVHHGDFEDEPADGKTDAGSPDNGGDEVRRDAGFVDAADVGVCDPASCVGCCLVGSGCLLGSANSACGLGGEQCQDCTSIAGGVCKNSRCFIPTQPCGSANCGGCCDANMTCIEATADHMCGGQGEVCWDCTETLNKFCRKNTCVPCDAITCPAGCCAADGNCLPGDWGSACGSSGVACVNCEGTTNKYCFNQTCAPCNADTCSSGCCDVIANCVSQSNAQCGNAGATCQDCTAGSAKYCYNSVCTPCNVNTCPGGCCDANGVCQPAVDGGCI